MIFPLVRPLSFVTEAVNALDAKLSLPQRSNLALVLSAILLLKTLCLSMICLGALEGYCVSTLSHFFSYAGLDGQQLMVSAIRLAGRLLPLGKIKLVIDDTMKHHSRFCRCIEGVYWLFDHVLNTHCKAKCIVFAYLVVNECIRFPIGWRVYRKDGPGKWKLAIELVDQALSCGLTIEVVLFDSWYCVSGFVKQLQRRKLHFISEVKSSLIAEYTVEGRRVGLPIGKLFAYGVGIFKEVWLGLKSNEADKPDRVLYKTYGLAAYLKAFKCQVKLIKSVDQRSGAFKIFVTDELTWEAQKVLEEYSYRWLIEEFFKNAKGLYGLKEAYIRSEQGGALALFLVSFVDLLISIRLWESVHGHSGKKLPTVSAIIASAVEENLRNLLPLCENRDQFAGIIEKWFKILERQRLKTRKERRQLMVIEPAEDNPSEASAQAPPESAQVCPQAA